MFTEFVFSVGDVPPEPSGVSPSVRGSTESTVHGSRRTSVSSASSNIAADFEEMHMHAAAPPTINTEDAVPHVPQHHIEEMDEHSHSVSRTTAVVFSNLHSVEENHTEFVQVAERAALEDLPDDDDDDGGNQMMDEVVEEHPLLLRGDREIPFTYLSSLSTKWASMKDRESSLQGKIKV